jgi:siroheme decarboxylase
LKAKPTASLSELEKAVIGELTGDLEVTSQPFAPLARDLGISQRKLLGIVRRLKEEGYIRRFGATLRHRNSGFAANAMVVWKVPDNRIDEAGKTMASFREVTHCYHRPPQKDWEYNLFTMIHGATEAACRQIALKISRATGVNNYRLLFSTRELKKTTMRYFYQEDA